MRRVAVVVVVPAEEEVVGVAARLRPLAVAVHVVAVAMVEAAVLVPPALATMAVAAVAD